MWNYDQLSCVQQGLLDQNIIALRGEVDDAMGRYVEEAIQRLTARGSPEVLIMITSKGGAVPVGLDICDQLRLYKGKKVGRVVGMAYSMALVILQVCDVREVARHSNVMIHHVSTGQISLDVMRNPKRAAKMRERMEADQRRLYAILMSRSKQPLAKVRAMCAREQFFTAEEAIAARFADTIV